MIYDSLGMYVSQNRATLVDENIALQAVLDAIQIALLDGIGNSNTSEFMLNDGQTLIKGINRNPLDLVKIKNAIKEMMMENENRINGRMYRNVNAKNFINTHTTLVFSVAF